MVSDHELRRTARRLKNVALFAHLSEEALEMLAQKMETCSFEPDQVLLSPDDAVDTLFVFRSGWAKISTHDPQGHELEISHVGPGHSIGDLSLLDGEPYQVSVTALVTVHADVLQRRDFQTWLDENPQYAVGILQGLSEKVRQNTTYVQKAIEWNTRIAQGDYSLPMEEIYSEHTYISTRARPDEAMVAEFLAAFNSMVEGVKQREDSLKQQIQDLSIKVDPNQVDREVDDLTDNTFFKDLKAARDRLRKPDDTNRS